MIVKNENDGLKTRLAEARKAVENEKKRHTDANNALINANTKRQFNRKKSTICEAQIAELKTRLEKKKKKRRGVTSSFDFLYLMNIMKLEMELHAELPREICLIKNYLLFGD